MCFQEEAKIVHIPYAEGFRVDFSNVTITCSTPVQGRRGKFEERLMSPRTINSPSDGRGLSPEPAKQSMSGYSGNIFKMQVKVMAMFSRKEQH